jgi:hypothetical protein
LFRSVKIHTLMHVQMAERIACSGEENLLRKVMNGAPQRPSSRRMLFDGRIEKRISIAVSVYLVRKKESRASEMALTENVSPHGARVGTKQICQPGEELLITPSSDCPQLARAVYCQPGAKGNFCVGVEFEGRSVKWGDLSSGKPC